MDWRPYAQALAEQVTTLDGPVNLNTPQYLGTIERWYLRQ